MARKQRIASSLIVLGPVFAACSVSIGTKHPESAPQQENQEGSSEVSGDPHQAYLARQQERQKEEQEQWEAQQAAKRDREAERERQAGCKAKLLEQRRQASQQAQASQERDALSSCPDSGIPQGTYKTERGLPHVELQVTEGGCAAYEAIAFHKGVNSRHLETKDGTREIEYEQGYECTVGGVLDSQRRPLHSRWQGNGCRRKILDVLAEGVSWSLNGNTVSAMANDAGGKRRVTLLRIDHDASGWNDGSPLWEKQRRESTDQVRVSLVGAQPTEGQGVGCAGRSLGAPCDPDAGRDWCADLKVEQAASH